MKLHRLDLQAFGPYGGAESVDFDALGAHGLHLIHGATGAGKTSILDALCFALYGRIPGARTGQRETLVSDHAAEGVRPSVRLEFTVARRRMRIERSPEHTAPKKRGSGVTRRQARVVLQEHRDGEWAAIATRLDEAGDVIHDLLGMHLDQFAQVVLLPQGEFAHFLRAKPEERGEVLRKLFDIARFGDVEDYLVRHRRRLHATADEFDQRVHADLARAEEAVCAVDLGIDYDQWHAGDPVHLPGKVSDAAATLDEVATTVMAEADRAALHRDEAREALTTAETTTRLQAQAAAARAALDRYAESAPERDADRTRLDRARAADRVAPYRVAHDRRRVAMTQADAAYDAALEAARGSGVVEDNGAPDVTSLRDRFTDGTTILHGAAPIGRRAQALRSTIDTQAERVCAIDADLEASSTHAAQIRHDLDRQAETLRAAEASAADLPEATRRIDAIDAALSALEDLDRARAEHRRARREAQARTREFAAAEERTVSLRRRRLEGIAAELAVDLADGSPCAVCGSTAHPSPASPDADSVGPDDLERAESAGRAASDALTRARSDEAAARARADGAESAFDAAWSAVTDADLASLVESPDDPDAAAGHLRALRNEAGDRLTAAKDAAATRERTAAHVEELQTSAADLDELHARAREEHAAAVTALESSRADLADCERRLVEAVADHAGRCACPPTDPARVRALDDVRRDHAETERLVVELDRAREARDTARAEAERSRADLDESLRDHGFASADAARGALLDGEEQVQLQSALEAAREEHAAARGVLDLPQIAEALAASPPDLDALQAAVAEANRAATQARTRQTAIERAQQSLQTLQARVTATLEQSAPVRAELATIDPLTDLVTGDGDNRLRMRLTSYVLAARLETVTALANEKLHVMTAGRFSLEHSDALARRGAKSGLGLRVRDAWTGATRDTATLSGGESFMASLALALGLGEAVLQTSGGRALQTLFVDEGFGSLDETSLEQVMEVLDGLRAGGRSVGIVSHVRELHDRIPAQIHVRKTSNGSTIDVVRPQPDAA